MRAEELAGLKGYVNLKNNLCHTIILPTRAPYILLCVCWLKIWTMDYYYSIFFLLPVLVITATS